MIDNFHLPTANPHADIQIFNTYAYGNTDSTYIGTQWYQWTKPRGRSMCSITCVNGGGGGGGGFTGIAGSARGGGGGGGSGSISRLIIPSIFLPDQLFIQVGNGGNGKVSGDGGLLLSDGYQTRVSIFPMDTADITPTNIILLGGGQAAGQAAQGASGTVAAGGTAGTGGTIAIISEMLLAGLGVFSAVAGQDGTAGGAQTGAVGGAIAFPTTGAVIMGGTGGGGVTATGQAGGLITAVASSYLSSIRPINAGVAENGTGAINIWKPFFSFPGMGGGSGNAVIGGVGGQGIYGSGGGGGGGGTTGGRGGNGGHGLVIIVCW